MCYTNIILVFVITDYIISSTIIGISVAIGQGGNDDVYHSGDSVSTLQPTLKDETQVRLVDGHTNNEGRVEVYANGHWGTICDTSFDTNNALVVCKMLKLNKTDAIVRTSAYYGEGNGPIWLDDVRCVGIESNIKDCGHRGLGVHNCGHNNDVGVMCVTDTGQAIVRLVDGQTAFEGRVEIFKYGRWGTVCDDFFDSNNALVVCNMLNMTVTDPIVKAGGVYGEGNDPIWLDDVVCLGNESNIEDCGHSGFGNSNCDHYEDVGVICASDSAQAQVRLVDGLTNSEGRVEVYKYGLWGTVCRDDFESNDALVVCNMLNITVQDTIVLTGGYYKEGKGPILLDDVHCLGNESNIEDCAHRGWGHHNCLHNEDVGVMCLEDSGQAKVRLVDGLTNFEGRVEVYKYERWGTVCSDFFDSNGARVLCKMLNMNVTDGIVKAGAYYGQGNGQIWLDDVNCLGNESNIEDCAHGGWGHHNCLHNKDVGVMCVTDSGQAEVRLVDGPTYLEGRVEVYKYGHWGTVCRNDFDSNDALVVCNMLNITIDDATVKMGSHYGKGIGPIWLDDVHCVGNESNIEDCAHRGWGHHNCLHNEDVGVQCVTGKISRSCAASIEQDREWPAVLDGQISLKGCGEGYRGDVYRRCQNGNYLSPVNNCTKIAIQDLHVQVFNGSLNSTEALSRLKQETNILTTDSKHLPTAGDLQNVNQILDKVIDDIEINSVTIVNDTDSFFEVANNLLDGNSTSSWKSLINDKGVGADSVINTIDRFITKVVNTSVTVLNKTFEKPNLLIEIGQVDRCDNIMFPSTAANTKQAKDRMGDQIVVGCGTEIGKKVFSGSLFKNMSGMLPSTTDIDSLDSSINGPVLAFSFYGHELRKEDVMLTFHVFDRKLRKPACSFWDTNQSEKGHWSTNGCTLKHFDTKKGTVSCHCDHLTNFAVLMSPAITTETETIHHRRLGVLSIVGCSISIIGLVLTITTYVCFWRAVRSNRSVLLLNLCTVLVLAYVLFLAGVNFTSHHAVCTSIAVLLHYIFLAAFFLMLSEGCIIAQMVLRPLDKRNILKILLGISYELPLVVVVISATLSKLKGYGNDKFCWLSIDSGLFWAFAGPALTIIFTNTIITVAVIKRLFGTSAMSKRGDADKIKTGLRSVCILLPVFGITWLFGVFAVNKDTVVFQYLFVIFNSIQGVLIFIVQCIMDRKVQEAFRARRPRWLEPEVSTTAIEMKTKSSAVGKSSVMSNESTA
ncbi:deleted in malignant brain tumors 1 protein-like isoform X1 [Mya arenaria]|uniref:deleted in malignant brain tumors 1 protein-like isoform X1 n=1 Tax=Mya arenaria TaxID=6604 RepID=UPI0022DFAA8B|nr:deleted in malignant brain tumors 1 protein-like isoform X1 [Mya arenaria]